MEEQDGAARGVAVLGVGDVAVGGDGDAVGGGGLAASIVGGSRAGRKSIGDVGSGTNGL
ncbi:hypothetical protein [Haloplanus rubicundus]|uniref:hypothetical protein n=1 Tax=Haloplanus rubicundus TaxID=1547898 RepID=UPI00130021C7|nr:hypothetical protein [Haloplanus rubicundus]